MCVIHSVIVLTVALPHTLTEMTMHLEDPKVGIVHQLPFTMPESSFAGVLDSVSAYACVHVRTFICVHGCVCCIANSHVIGVWLQFQVYFGTQHARVYLCADVFKQNCANGMSWLIRKPALLAEGSLMYVCVVTTVLYRWAITLQ